MPLKRPAYEQETNPGSYSQSSSQPPPGAKRAKLSHKLDVKVYLVQAKLDAPSVGSLLSLAEHHTRGVCQDPRDADVIVTAIGMRKRLERHVDWDIAVTKAVVTPQWLRDSVRAGAALPCEDYVAIQDLHDTTMKNCPRCTHDPCACGNSSKSETVPPQVSVAGPSVSRLLLPRVSEDDPQYLLPPQPPIPTDVSKLDYTSRYACRRPSPLVCPNQALATELNVLRRSRTLDGDDRSALSYERAVSILKAYPHHIRSLRQVGNLPHIGPKIALKIEEFIDTGKVSEAETIKSSERFKVLSLFTSVYGIGPTSARRLFNLGLRSLEDLEIYYGVERYVSPHDGGLVEMEQAPQKPGGGKHMVYDDGLGDNWVRVALGLRGDLEKKIPRAEAEEMYRVVVHELNDLEPGFVSIMAGGYRRGKPESNDLDIVFTHPDRSKIGGMCKRFLRRLYNRGMITHVMHLGSYHSQSPNRANNLDSIEKSLTVIVLPPDSSFYTGTKRRLDLIFAPPELYWTAVLGWTGSVMFERDIRQWAKDKCGMKFDSSGIVRQRDSKEFFPRSEKEVFELLGLEWIDPTLRNADL
ncbi:Nucleotidyltransferase [Epithele typhae]|uniref:Nucleotidyltransferase n=1 Tax=Epithele typhae TaxID=378194 RepID=UPI002007FB9A|nr:Nucleotidyltransferase [Epithele typhae]KAH9925944.1 Nucleotidyltransferase [Epithele typhae]